MASSTRRSEWNATGKLRIEDKEKMRKAGLKSPDRADALLACIALGAHHSGLMSERSAVRTRSNPMATRAVKGFNAL